MQVQTGSVEQAIYSFQKRFQVYQEQILANSYNILLYHSDTTYMSRRYPLFPYRPPSYQ